MNEPYDFDVKKIIGFPVDAPYVRWLDSLGVVHAAGQTSLTTWTFCDVELRERHLESSVVVPVNCVMCIAQAEERGILP
jgi:hypothetical protein